MGKIFSVNVSEDKGSMKRPVDGAELVAGAGVRGDAHSAPGARALSLMMIEDIEESKRTATAEALEALADKGIDLGPGAYAENLTTAGIDLASLAIGDELVIGGSIRVRVSKLGKKCHQGCEVRAQLGDCIFPRKGIFAEVVTGGAVRAGDSIEKS